MSTPHTSTSTQTVPSQAAGDTFGRSIRAELVASLPIFFSVFAAAAQVSSLSLRADNISGQLGQGAIGLSYVAVLASLPRAGLVRKQAVFATLLLALMVASLLSRTDNYQDFDRRFVLTLLVLIPALWASMNDQLTMRSAGYALVAGLSLPVLVNLIQPGPLLGYINTNSIGQLSGIDSAVQNYNGISRAFGVVSVALLAQAFHGPAQLRKVLGLSAFPFALLCAAGGGRAQLLSLILVCTVLIVVCGVGRQLYFAVLPFFGAGLFLATLVDGNRFRGVLRLTTIIEQRSSADRFDLWLVAVDYTSSSPKNFFVGGGATGFSVDGVDAIGYTPHNIVLEAAAIWGVPLALALTVLLVNVGRRFVRASRIGQRADETAFFAVLAFLIIPLAASSSLFQSPITFLVIALSFRFVVAEPDAGGADTHRNQS